MRKGTKVCIQRAPFTMIIVPYLEMSHFMKMVPLLLLMALSLPPSLLPRQWEKA